MNVHNNQEQIPFIPENLAEGSEVLDVRTLSAWMMSWRLLHESGRAPELVQDREYRLYPDVPAEPWSNDFSNLSEWYQKTKEITSGSLFGEDLFENGVVVLQYVEGTVNIGGVNVPFWSDEPIIYHLVENQDGNLVISE